ncbi:hypothetical protein [Candidatus Amarolinea dominans]|uniref:hypothetical protein n=1 Tax=Candidatus Amarolinea dominans TaxID=3140696 RepID=UPI003134B45F|nr:hypothetical protein [Anaerolineae bacterium]
MSTPFNPVILHDWPEYSEQIIAERRAESEASDIRFANDVLTRIAEGAPTYSHEEVWAEIEQLEAANELSNSVRD